MSSRATVYLDYNATTPCAPEVVDVMLPFFGQDFGNPASPHVMGRRSAAAVSDAREAVAATVGCDAGEIYFTSGATESNNLVLLGLAPTTGDRKRIVTTAIEHKSVLGPCEFLETRGYQVIRLPVNHDGVVDVDAARAEIDEKTLLVSIQGANNEVGTIQPVAEIAGIARKHGAMMHSDCAQMLGKLPFSVLDLGVDFASVSAHKVYGPKGVGAVFVRQGLARACLRSVLFGGGQESAIRPGTSNVPGIVGFGAACRLACGSLDVDRNRVSSLRRLLERALLEGIDGALINGVHAPRLPNTISLTTPGVPADMLIANLADICLSDGSACNSGAMEPSYVLANVGLNRTLATQTVRISLGKYTTQEDVLVSADFICSSVRELRGLTESSGIRGTVGPGQGVENPL